MIQLIIDGQEPLQLYSISSVSMYFTTCEDLNPGIRGVTIVRELRSLVLQESKLQNSKDLPTKRKAGRLLLFAKEREEVGLPFSLT